MHSFVTTRLTDPPKDTNSPLRLEADPKPRNRRRLLFSGENGCAVASPEFSMTVESGEYLQARLQEQALLR
ncbi:MAG: hypothetical protein OXI96_04065 [Acidimicrobiaceae bacterium]|nr:hypothetical protein [Acidimicrobiaceae bacterium]